jgi:mRNA-degrading endonuclease RelE of RelBE toxin-antitoxin system
MICGGVWLATGSGGCPELSCVDSPQPGGDPTIRSLVSRRSHLAACTPVAYNQLMRFIETPVFTRAIVELLDEETYRCLQLALVQRPESGALILKSGGLRKLRWSLPGRGKRGGLRVIYFWDRPSETFYLLYAYPKNAQEDLTAQQVRVLGRLVREEFG